MSEPKQVIAVRTDLNMRKGKMCAQAAHASMKVFLDRSRVSDNGEYPNQWPPAWLLIPLDERTKPWLLGIFTKIVVGAGSEAELLTIFEKANSAGVMASLVQDVGKTEFAGVKTYTAVAVGPDAPEKIDAITGHLKLI